MKLRLLVLALLVGTLGLAGTVHADLGVFLNDLSISARQDPGGFRAELGAHFAISGARLDLVLRSVNSPADAVVVLWLGERSGQPPERVLRAYRKHRRQGWGAVAHSLGIKPGSADFHALKAGELGWHPENRPNPGKGHGRGRGHGNKHRR